MQQRIRRGVVLLGVAGLISVFTACDSLFGSGEDVLGNQLRANQQKWAAAGPPPAYRLDMIVFEGTDTTAVAVRIHVRNGSVESATYVDSGEPVPPAQLGRYPAVEGLFDIIRDALGRRVAAMAIHYAETYGFPLEISIDYDHRSASDNLYIATDNFALE